MWCRCTFARIVGLHLAVASGSPSAVISPASQSSSSNLHETSRRPLMRHARTSSTGVHVGAMGDVGFDAHIDAQQANQVAINLASTAVASTAVYPGCPNCVPRLKNIDFSRDDVQLFDTPDYVPRSPSGWEATANVFLVKSGDRKFGGYETPREINFVGMLYDGSGIRQTVDWHMVGQAYRLSCRARFREGYNPANLKMAVLDPKAESFLNLTSNATNFTARNYSITTGQRYINPTIPPPPTSANITNLTSKTIKPVEIESLSNDKWTRYSLDFTPRAKELTYYFENVSPPGDRTVFISDIVLSEIAR